MKTDEVKNNEMDTLEQTVPFREQVFVPDELIPMTMELTTYDERLFAESPPTKPEKTFMADRPARKIRYERLLAVLRAYGFLDKLNPKHPVYSFICGDFIRKGATIDNTEIEKRLTEYCRDIEIDNIIVSNPRRPFTADDHAGFFSGVFHYAITLHQADNFFWGYVIMGAGVERAHRLISPFNASNNYQIFTLHEPLMLYITGESVKPYTTGELIDNFGYPPISDEELSEIDVRNF